MNSGKLRPLRVLQFAAIAALMLLSANVVYNGRQDLARSTAVLEQEQAALAREQAALNRILAEKNDIGSDAFIERILRNEFGMLRPDERVFIIVYN